MEVVVTRDDVTTSGFATDFRAWAAVTDRIALHELDAGGHYFVSTRPRAAADVVRAVVSVPALGQ